MIEKRRQGFDVWLSKYKIKTTIILVSGLWMNLDAYQWCKQFVASSSLSGVEIAGIIVAVQGLATSYVLLAYKIYMENRNQ